MEPLVRKKKNPPLCLPNFDSEWHMLHVRSFSVHQTYRHAFMTNFQKIVQLEKLKKEIL